MKRQIALTLALLVSLAGLANAGIVNVPGDYSQINAAVQACAPGDTVLVASGTYYDCIHPTEGAESTPACVIMKSDVTLMGSGAEQTTIDAQGLGRGIFMEQTSNCSILNLTVMGAYADVYGPGILIRNVDSTVLLDGLLVTGNADGGIVCINGASPVISNCIVDNNEAKQGGGIAIEEGSHPLVTHCTISNNAAPSGAGMFLRGGCTAVIEFCTIENNHITENWGNGGGIAIQDSDATITSCSILGNSTLGHGGGVAYLGEAGGTLEDSLIQANECSIAYGSGAGLYTENSNPQITNCVIADNTCTVPDAEGGGIDCQFTPSPTVTNCTFVNNSCGANYFGGAISVQWSAEPIFERCIIANSPVGQGIYCTFATPVVSCCDIYGNAGGDAICGTDAGGNFSADPGFCNGLGGLNEGGPCAAGNHPDGGCDDLNIGAAVTCGGTPVPDAYSQSITLGNMPNPFNPMTIIYFDLPRGGSAQLSIFTLDGRLVKTESWDNLPQGRTEYQWNGTNEQGRASASGVYLYKVNSQGQSSTKRMSLIR